MKYENIDLTLFKITAAPKTRLLRQLNREQNPDVNEIVRRFEADKEEYMKIDFDYIELQNETLEDADKAILEIMRAGAAAAMDKTV
jgi:guanylate kinase